MGVVEWHVLFFSDPCIPSDKLTYQPLETSNTFNIETETSNKMLRYGLYQIW